jgi:hypothetical protein
MCEERGLVSRVHGDFKNTITASNVFWALRRNLNKPSINGGFRGGDFSVRSAG